MGLKRLNLLQFQNHQHFLFRMIITCWIFPKVHEFKWPQIESNLIKDKIFLQTFQKRYFISLKLHCIVDSVWSNQTQLKSRFMRQNFWSHMNKFKSAATHSFKILCCWWYIVLSNEVLLRCQSLRFEKILLWVELNPNLLTKKGFDSALTRFSFQT